MTEASATRLNLWRSLLRVPHREYGPLVTFLHEALEDEPDFIARACTYLVNTSKIRDHQDCAVIALLQSDPFYEYREAGQALLLGNDVYQTEPSGFPPYRIFRVEHFIRNSERKIPRRMESILRDYFGMLEKNRGRAEGVVLGNRKQIKSAWKHFHIHPSDFPYLHDLLFGEPPEGSKLAFLKEIANCDDPRNKLRLVKENNIGYRVLQSVLDSSIQSRIILIEAMSPTEALNSRSWVEREGLMQIPEVKKVYLEKIRGATRSVASAEHRASAQGQDEEIQKAVDEAKEKSVKQDSHRIEGQTDIYLDKSGSMSQAISAVPQLARRIYPLCDDVALFIHDASARRVHVEDTGNPLQDVTRALRGVRAGGGTLMAPPFEASLREGRNPDKIVFLTDGDENRNSFVPALKRYEEETGKSPTLVVIKFDSGYGGRTDLLSTSIKRAGYPMTKIDWTGDWMALDNCAAALAGAPQMSVADVIMQTELPTIDGLAY